MKKTPLHSWHMATNAKMGEFGGCEMPMWYLAGARKEHFAVLTSAGIFDTSHMSVITVRGEFSFQLLQKTFTRDLTKCLYKNKVPLTPGYCIYGAFLSDHGEVIDDAILYQMSSNSYMVVINSGMGDEISNHLLFHSKQENVEISDCTGSFGKIDIQGPLSAKILTKVLENAETTMGTMPFFSFKGGFISSFPTFGQSVKINDGTKILLSRTGYTGEFGYEIFVDIKKVVTVWEKIFEAGKDLGILPCGLAARDSLRVGAMLPLAGHDIGKWPFINNPWTFALPFNIDGNGFTKPFVGDKALLNISHPYFTFAFVGHDPRKVSAGNNCFAYDMSGEKVGTVLSCVTDVAIEWHNKKIYCISSPDKPKNFNPRGLSCGFIKVNKKYFPGQILELKDSRRTIKVVIADNIRPNKSARK